MIRERGGNGVGTDASQTGKRRKNLHHYFYSVGRGQFVAWAVGWLGLIGVGLDVVTALAAGVEGSGVDDEQRGLDGVAQFD